MPDTGWVARLTVAQLKGELSKRGQQVSGKKAELAERLRAHVKQHEVRSCLGGRGSTPAAHRSTAGPPGY